MNSPGTKAAAILAAAAVAAPGVIQAEGWVNKAYNDPVGIVTACAGVTVGVVRGKAYSDGECLAMVSAALAQHGAEIYPCLPETLPLMTRGAFTSFAYNVGSTKFCASTLAKKARAGDLAGACNELPRWVYAGKTKLPGLVKRRAAERALCERGLG